jgi:polyphosphate kinase 2 (PPK2 family)
MQQLHYASNSHAVLLIFQAMDAAGKDGAIRHVMSGVNPQGCQVFSFKPRQHGRWPHGPE